MYVSYPFNLIVNQLLTINIPENHKAAICPMKSILTFLSFLRKFHMVLFWVHYYYSVIMYVDDTTFHGNIEDFISDSFAQEINSNLNNLI